MNNWVSAQLGEYKSQHQNFFNEVLHFFGIPTIILSFFIFANLFLPLTLLILGLMFLYITLGGWRGWIVALIAGGMFWVTVKVIQPAYTTWIIIEFLVFSLLTVYLFLSKVTKMPGSVQGVKGGVVNISQILSVSFMAILVYLQYRLLKEWGFISLKSGVLLLAAGLSYQIPGHILFEGNKPAFTKSLFQILIAPLWLAEVIISIPKKIKSLR